MKTGKGDQKYQVSLAVEHIRSAFSILDENGEKAEIEDMALLKKPAQLFCNKTGNWRLAPIDVVSNEREVFDVRVDQSMFNEHTGDLEALIDYAETLYRISEMKSSQVDCLKKPEPKNEGMCWVRTPHDFLSSRQCLCRARESKLTCLAHDDFEKAANSFKEAQEKFSNPQGDNDE